MSHRWITGRRLWWLALLFCLADVLWETVSEDGAENTAILLGTLALAAASYGVPALILALVGKTRRKVRNQGIAVVILCGTATVVCFCIDNYFLRYGVAIGTLTGMIGFSLCEAITQKEKRACSSSQTPKDLTAPQKQEPNR